jgi:hypothetical protein
MPQFSQLRDCKPANLLTMPRASMGSVAFLGQSGPSSQPTVDQVKPRPPTAKQDTGAAREYTLENLRGCVKIHEPADSVPMDASQMFRTAFQYKSIFQ